MVPALDARKAHGQAGQLVYAGHRMRDGLEESSHADLRILRELARAHGWCGGDAGCEKPLDQRVAIVLTAERAEPSVDLVLVGPATAARREQLRRPRWTAEHVDQRGPLRVGHHGDRDPLLGAATRVEVLRRGD